ncbi:sigma-70 family RNA polymerase sigma factor [PVC group bacterium]|nr:sigma-70 family RNA polymerase sigma factor [PVC group bacterium]
MDWLHSIVKRYERPLCQYAYSILNNAETAREVVQDSFLKLCQQSRNRIEKKIPAWLFLVCRNRALDVIRKNKRMMELDEKQEAELVSARRRPDENAVVNENVSIVLKLLAKLPENQREVIRLKFQQELSYREIASITELSESNVGYLIHVGIKDLRGRMAVL